jgi:porin
MRAFALAVGVLACAPAAAKAQALGAPAHVFGDWNGARSKLHASGVDLLVTYVNEIAANSQGGRSREASYADQIMVDANFDLQTMAGIGGASVHVSLTDRNGVDLKEKAGLGTLLSPQEIYGYGRTTRLAQLYYQQKLWADRVTIKLGRLPMSGDIFPFSCEFQNLTFCGAVPGYITPNWFTWPASQWAVSVNSKLSDTLQLETAVYQVNPSFTRNDQGLELGNPSGTTGAHVVAELTWAPRPRGLRGAYRVGVWRNTGRFVDLDPDPAQPPVRRQGGEPRTLNHASGYYLMAQQPIHQNAANPRRSLDVFANFIQSDRDVSYVETVWEAGVFWRGPLARRPVDTLGVAVGRLSVNKASRRHIAQQNARSGESVPVPNIEYPIEVYYAWAAAPGIVARPNVQYIANPGGIAKSKDVVVFGLKTSLNF